MKVVIKMNPNCIKVPAFLAAAWNNPKSTITGLLSWGAAGMEYYHLPNWQAALHDPSCIVFVLLGFLGVVASDGKIVDNPLVGQVVNSGAIGALVSQVIQAKPGVAK